MGAGKGQGLSVFVRDTLLPFVSLAERSEFFVWLRVALPGCMPLFCCCAYVPPRSSPLWKHSDGRMGDGWREVFASLFASVGRFAGRGEVAVFGDLNAHTAGLDDVGSASQAVADDLGQAGVGVSAVHVPQRRTRDNTAACEYGRVLCDLVSANDCVILNGRTPGDEGGYCTFVPRARRHSPSVLDYGIVSRRLFPCVADFHVLNPRTVPAMARTSDHCILRCVLRVPAALGLPPADGRPLPPSIKWDASKRQQYQVLLCSDPEFCERRQAIMRGLAEGRLGVDEASERWCDVVRDAAKRVFGVAGRRGSGSCMPSGHRPKAWFRECRPEHAVLQAALRAGDSHAAAEARRRFNAKKRVVQRRMGQQREAALMRDIRHNPRRFWTAYRGSQPAALTHDLSGLTQHWQQLYAPAGAGGLRETAPSAQACAQSFSASLPVSEGDVAAAADLNADFQADEIVAAVRKLKPGRMAGPDGLRGELFRGLYCVQIVFDEGRQRSVERHVYDAGVSSPLHDLCVLLNAAFKAAAVPRVWCSAFLSAVLKRGDPSDLDNYRGIAVGSALGKILSLVLHARLTRWSEARGLRAQGQAGFRDGHRTSDHVFVLKHLIDRSRAASQRLFVCFVDFKKAYDSVRRDLMLQCLADMGVHGEMLHTVASMYWEAPVAVKAGLQVGDFFDTTRGVKQGDPLSPLLFGLFIDRVEKWMRDRVPACGVDLGGQLLRVLLYADDLALTATSKEDLQLMLDALGEFCAAHGMEVNVGKSCVVVFGKRPPRSGVDIPTAGWLYGGVTVPLESEFRYLGVVFHQCKGVSACTAALRGAGLRAMWGMLRRCADMESCSLSLKVELFDYIVAPVLNFCCDVWGPSLLRPTVDASMDNDVHKVQTLFLRQVAGGVRNSTSRQLLLREFGAKPLARSWVHACVGLWNRVARLGGGSLMRAAMLENLGVQSSRVVRTWSAGFRDLLAVLQCVPDQGLVNDGVLHELPVERVMAAFDEWWFACWEGLPLDPREQSDASGVLTTYNAWFAAGGEVDAGRWSQVPGYVQRTAGIPAPLVRSLAAFRLGAHDLAVAVGRFTGEERGNRVCPKCDDGSVGDELHMIFECPAMDVARQRFPSLFAPFGGWESVRDTLHADDMPAFMHTDAQGALAAFVHHCWLLRGSEPPDEFVFGDCLDVPGSSSGFESACDDAFELSSEMEDFFRDLPYEPAGSNLVEFSGDVWEG